MVSAWMRTPLPPLPGVGARIIGLQGPVSVTSREVRLLLGDECTGRGAMQDRAMLVLVMAVPVARRQQELLSGTVWWGGEDPPRQNGWRDKPPPGRRSAAHPNTDGTTNTSAQSPPEPDLEIHSNQIWLEIFLSCSTDGQNSNDAGHHKKNRGSPNTGQG